MIDRVGLKKGESCVLDLNQLERCETPLFDQLELWLDHHYGIRVIQDGDWTKVSFREAGTWSEPIAARDLYRKLSGAKKPAARAAKRPRKH